MKKIEITKNKHLYKYFSINEFLLRSLINNELYFSKPSNFNDPFDCQFILNLVENSEAEKQFIKNLDIPDSEIKHYKTSQIKKEISIGLEESLIQGVNNLLGVSCFSETINEILMWSHYADKHKGICLKFDWSVNSEYFQGDKVIYSDKLHKIEYSSTEKFHEEIKTVVLTKLKTWSYEFEVRSVVEIKENRNLSFNPKALVGIIFGEKTESNDIDLIKRIINLHGNYKHVKFYKATMSRKESQMKINAM